MPRYYLMGYNEYEHNPFYYYMCSDDLDELISVSGHMHMEHEEILDRDTMAVVWEKDWITVCRQT